MLTTPTPSDIPALKTIWHNVFGDDLADIDRFFQTLYANKNTLIWKDSDKLVSMLYMLPYEHNVYLYALATLPEYRGCGIMKKLINEACQRAAKQGAKGVFLIPAEGMETYYERFGFALYNGRELDKNRPPATDYEMQIQDFVEYLDETFIPETIMAKDFGGFNIKELFGYIPF